MADVRQMGDRELDAAIAQRVFQRVARYIEVDDEWRKWNDDGWFYGDADLIAEIEASRGVGGYDAYTISNYTTDRNACAEMEAEIARRGLTVKYLGCLCDVTGADFTPYAYDTAFEENLWLVTTATPRQRCEAAYLALEGTHDA